MYPATLWVGGLLVDKATTTTRSTESFTDKAILASGHTYPQALVDARLGVRPDLCSHSEYGEGRPATNDDGPLAPNPLATRGAVVSMPAARSDTPGYPPDRTQLDDPLPLSVCVAEVTHLLLTREC